MIDIPELDAFERLVRRSSELQEKLDKLDEEAHCPKCKEHMLDCECEEETPHE